MVIIFNANLQVQVYLNSGFSWQTRQHIDCQIISRLTASFFLFIYFSFSFPLLCGFASFTFELPHDDREKTNYTHQQVVFEHPNHKILEEQEAITADVNRWTLRRIKYSFRKSNLVFFVLFTLMIQYVWILPKSIRYTPEIEKRVYWTKLDVNSLIRAGHCPLRVRVFIFFCET